MLTAGLSASLKENSNTLQWTLWASAVNEIRDPLPPDCEVCWKSS